MLTIKLISKFKILFKETILKNKMPNLFDNKIKSIFQKANNKYIDRNCVNLGKFSYNIVIKQNSNDNKLGQIKHSSPAIKEWPNSVYNYNKNSIKSLPSDYSILTKILRSYFNLTSFYNLKDLSGDKKVRVIRKYSKNKRKSVKKIFVSKPEIKHVNDKIIITVHILNRERDSITRKLYFMNKSFVLDNNLKSKNSFYKLNLFSEHISAVLGKVDSNKEKDIYVNSMANKNAYVSPINKGNRWQYYYSLRVKQSNFHKPFSKSKRFTRKSLKNVQNHQVKKNVLERKITDNLLRKKYMLKNIFFYSFLKWILWVFKVKISIKDLNNSKLVTIKSNTTTSLLLKKDKHFLTSLRKINTILLHLLTTILRGFTTNSISKNSEDMSTTKEQKVYLLFNYFKRQYYNTFIRKFMKKHILTLHQLYLLYINCFKVDKFLFGLKSLISKIMNKKIELNLINLKYVHLNSDILSEAIAIKLKAKKSRLLLIIKRFLRLVKLPTTINNEHNITTSSYLNKPNYISSFIGKYKKLNTNTLYSSVHFDPDSHDILQTVLHNIFNFSYKKYSSFNLFKVYNDRSNSILNTIKYKWVKGVRLEAKGRLTRRYTASRSVFKLKYKGNLKNLESINGMSSVMLRTDVKPNMEYGFTKSIKRIGAFGIKGWISGK